MTKPIGNFSILQGTNKNDFNFSITPGVAYFAGSGEDTLWMKYSAQLPLGGSNWWIPSIASGGNGNDKYYVEFGASTFIADASNSNADHLTVFDYLSKIQNFFSVDKRHIFISTSFGTNIFLIDALNTFGAIETIKFIDVTLSGTSNSIESLLSTYQTESDQSFESLIEVGYFNPKVMGVNGANEVRSIINTITEFTVAEPTYILTPSASTINEGSALTTSVATTDVASGTALYYSLSGTGINSSDFSSGSLTGSGTISSSGSFSFSHTLANDLTTEGVETVDIKLFSDATRTTQVGSTASVSIADTSVALTYYNLITNKTLNTWTAYQVTSSVKAGDIASQWFGTAAPATTQLRDISETKLMDVVASTWSDKVQINRVVKASDAGEKLEAKQIDIGSGEVAGSVISGGKGNDDIKGFAGWDNLEGGDGNDLIHGGNGRDIISGGAGRDELHGDFGWNTYKSEKDGVSDLIAVKSDHYLVNWLYGKAGNSPNGEKADIIEGLDPIDKIKIIGVDTREITFAANISAKGVTGIGIYGKGILEALYTGGDLTVAQITQMTSGDASAAAMSNSINAYGVW